MPHQARIVKGKLNINFTMFEASRVPQKWIKAHRRHDLVIVPTLACGQAWIRSGLPAEKIKLCPLGVNPDQFCPDAKPLMLEDEHGKKVEEYRTRVLNISDLTPRKNLRGLLKVWIKTTDRHDDAILIVKLNCRSERWLIDFMKDVESFQAEFCKSKNDAAPILFLINRMFSSSEIPGLFSAATHYWSMSHGEGWDLPMMEACATGLHIIAPNHSAYPTYLDPSLAKMIPARRVPAAFNMSDGTHKLFLGADWWDANAEVAATFLREAVDNPVAQRNHKLREKIVHEFTWDKATERLMNILSEFESTNRVNRKQFFQLRNIYGFR